MRKYALPLLIACLLATCGSPTDPVSVTTSGGATTLAAGRWSGRTACLSVEGTEAHLIAGCLHGRFARPVLLPDGTFSVDGTWRFEAGPVTQDNPPPAHFTGSLTGTTLTLKVQPMTGALLTFEVTLDGTDPCPTLCV